MLVFCYQAYPDRLSYLATLAYAFKEEFPWFMLIPHSMCPLSGLTQQLYEGSFQPYASVRDCMYVRTQKRLSLYCTKVYITLHSHV